MDQDDIRYASSEGLGLARGTGKGGIGGRPIRLGLEVGGIVETYVGVSLTYEGAADLTEAVSKSSVLIGSWGT